MSSCAKLCARKVMAYYPLHFVISCLFAPMFIQVERLGKKCPNGVCSWDLSCGWGRGSQRWYNTPWTTTAFRAFLNFSMLQAAVQVAKLRRETLQCFWPGLVPQGSRDLESAHLVPDPAKRATGF